MAKAKGIRGIYLYMAFVTAILFAVNLFCRYVPYIQKGTCEIHFLDVGQSEATLIVTRESTVLIDTGLRETEKVVYEAVTRYGKLDALILTHPHADHIGGAEYLIRHRKVRTLLLPQGMEEGFAELTATAEKYKCPVTYLACGETVSTEDLCFSVLAPLTVTAAEDGEENEICLVLRMEYGNISALFTADADGQSEEEQLRKYLATAGGLLDTDILKVPHHGSKYSSTAEYLAAVTPAVAVISCGENNSYGHPAPELLERIADYAIPVYRTDTDGTVILVTDGEIWWEK